MDYREYAKDLLGRKKTLTSAYSVIKTELEQLEQEKYSCKTLLSNLTEEDAEKIAVYEERLINILADLEDCRFRCGIVQRELTKIEKGINSLSDYYRDIIEMFFVERAPYAADELMERWYKERSGLYRDRSKALEQFTRSVYGIIEL